MYSKIVDRGNADARKAKSLRQVKRMAKRSHNTCIIFDRKLCGKEYRDAIGYFIPYGTCLFVPLKEAWSNKEFIECINAGLAYVLEYGCTSETIRGCIESIQSNKNFRSGTKITHCWGST